VLNHLFPISIFKAPEEIMRSMFFRIFAIMIIVSMVVSPVAAQTGTANREDVDIQGSFIPAPEAADTGVLQLDSNSLEISETGLYIFRLTDPSLAAYAKADGTVFPNFSEGRKLDVNTLASQTYLSFLEEKQAEFLAQANSILGHSPIVAFQYQNVINGLALEVSYEEAQTLAKLPGVLKVYPDLLYEIDTDEGPFLIGAPSIWEGETGSGMPSKGEGIIVGLIDTGINPFHPSFAEEADDGYVHQNPYGSGNFVGVCDPAEPTQVYDDICNNKLIGAWSFESGPNSGTSARDWHSHGSHVGSTIAGNIHEANFMVGIDDFSVTIHGVAPRANIISYLVCDPSCPTSATTAAMDQSIADGVDVMNASIGRGGGFDDSWDSLLALAFLDAFNAGMFVATSAGNSGPGAGTIDNKGPWTALVGNSTHQRIIANTATVLNPAPPPDLVGMGAL
jgi:subtilisin family serine protease